MPSPSSSSSSCSSSSLYDEKLVPRISWEMAAWFIRVRHPSPWMESWMIQSKERGVKRSTNRRYRESPLYSRESGSRLERLLRPKNRTSIQQLNVGFPYDPIDPKTQIRVLELEPGNEHEPLRGNLVTESLNNAAAYDAVSYCWESHKGIKTLDCGSVSLNITQSVSEILRRFRHRDEVRRLWIDAICLDQSDSAKAERSAQILVMADIYYKANTVIIWLGEEDETTADAFSLIAAAVPSCKAAHEKHGPSMTLLQLYECGVPDRLDRRWAALRSLIYRPYFSRTWILQEVANARHPEVWCGKHVCDGRVLEAFSRILHGTPARLALGVDYIAWASSVFGIASAQNGVDDSLRALLERATVLRSSDPRDKVFALIGMAHDKADFRELVNYEKSVDQVYHEAAKRLILQGWSDVLNCAQEPAWKNVQSLPSWVPDWSSASSSVRLTYILRGSQRTLDGVSVEIPRFSSGDRILTIKGCFKDKVQRIGERFRIGILRDSHIQQRLSLEQWRHMALKNSQTYPAGGTMMEAFARTVVANEAWHEISNFSTATAMYHAARSRYFHWFPVELTYDTDRDGAIFDYFENLLAVCDKRSFFLTDNGYIGIGPYFLRPGDLLVELYRGMTPFAIRPTKSGHYELVGEVYVHGWMGEVDHSSTTFEDIELV